ncbi:hypothetical protein Tco_0711943 [Tanacetum coccineum]
MVAAAAATAADGCGGGRRRRVEARGRVDRIDPVMGTILGVERKIPPEKFFRDRLAGKWLPMWGGLA